MSTDIKRFMIDLPLEAENIPFHLHPVNVREKQLYQVYTTFQGKEHRFHMQSSDGQNFKITDRARCPKDYLVLESALSEAIVNN